MKLYRITSQQYANSFSGRGASFDDGARWNSPGHPVIYFALNMATAMIEAANYHPSPNLIPKSHCKAIYEIDDQFVSCKEILPKDIPSDWDNMPYPRSTQIIGDDFLTSCDTLFLLVPSVALGLGPHNVELTVAVANPNHPDINKIKLIDTIQPVYSQRMFAGLK